MIQKHAQNGLEFTFIVSFLSDSCGKALRCDGLCYSGVCGLLNLWLSEWRHLCNWKVSTSIDCKSSRVYIMSDQNHKTSNTKFAVISRAILLNSMLNSRCASNQQRMLFHVMLSSRAHGEEKFIRGQNYQTR